MKKIRGKLFGGYFFMLTMLCMIFSSTSSAATNVSKDTAQVITFGQNVEGELEDNSGKIRYYKIDIPKDIGNQYITIAFSNYSTRDYDFYLRNAQDVTIFNGGSVKTNDSKLTWFRIKGVETTTRILLTPGESYYIRLEMGFGRGKYNLTVNTTSDDNIGTFQSAANGVTGQKKTGMIEYYDDIDCFYYDLPNDESKYTFYISTDNEIDALLADANGIKISDTRVKNNEINNELTVYGRGQRVFIRVQKANTNMTAANYSIELKLEKGTISLLNLSSCKKGGKKITGKTIPNAKVKVKIGKKKYTAKSDKTGKFTVKLKKKLKAKNKIKVTVSKKNYNSISKTFKVR